MRRYLAYRSSEVARLHLAKEGCLRHGPIQLLVAIAVSIGFEWDTHMLGWARLVCQG